MYSDRVALYKQLEEAFESRILTYITSDRPRFDENFRSNTYPHQKMGDTAL